MTDVPFPPLVQLLVLLACVALGLAHLLWGPTRALKIGVAVLVVGVASGIAIHSGGAAALSLVVLLIGVNCAAMGAAVLMHSMPIRKHLVPVEASSCPRHGQKKVADWTRGFGGLGFSHQGDFESQWLFAGQKRKSFIRFLVHHSRMMWVEIHVLDEPKMSARLVASRAEGDVHLATVDRQANEEFFRDPQTRVVRVASAATCADMIRRHEDRVTEGSGARQKIENPPAIHTELYDGWIRRLLQSRQLVSKGSTAKIPLRLVPPTVFRVMAAWFH